MKKTYYFPHDYHARHDPKLERLRMELGPVTDGIFWDLVEMLYEEDGHLLIKDIPLYAKMFNTDEQMLNKVVNSVFLTDGVRFYNQSLLDRLDHIQDVREERRLAGESSGKARQKNKRSTNDEHLSNNIKESKGDKVKESKEDKESKERVELTLKFWNERMPWKVREISGSRLTHLKERLKEKQFVGEFHTILTRILESDFLSGRTPSKDHKNFRADFDWLIKNDNNYIKILEGKYANAREKEVGI